MTREAEAAFKAWKPSREEIAKQIVSYLFQECQPDRGDIFGWIDDRALSIADAILALNPPAPPEGASE